MAGAIEQYDHDQKTFRKVGEDNPLHVTLAQGGIVKVQLVRPSSQTFEYDEAGQISAETVDGERFEYAYDEAGHVTSITKVDQSPEEWDELVQFPLADASESPAELSPLTTTPGEGETAPESATAPKK